MDPTQAIAGENYIGRQTRKAIPGLVGGNAGAAMALLGANKAGTATRIGRLRETYDNANAQIGNQVNQYNTGIKKDQAVARAANAAALENVRSQSIHKGAEAFGKMTKSSRQDNTEQDTLKMFQWRYQNEPGFRKYIDNFSTQNNSGEAIV
jgi:gas vesicle protein